MSNNDPLIWQVDAFTDVPFGGNPAAICLVQEYPSDEWMQQLASEMNLSETAFLVPLADPAEYQLRWFTPSVEVDLCGHATLAAAHVLWEQDRVEDDVVIRFQTRSGELACSRSASGITLDFPAAPLSALDDSKLESQLKAAMGIQKAEVLRTPFDLLMITESRETVVDLQPDFSLLTAVPTRGVIVTAAEDDAEFDFVSRFFAPRCGIEEDPVTGSAHCCLAPYWAQRLGTNTLVGYQASGRGGVVRCEVVADRVRLTGSAVTVLEGRLKVAVAGG
ncbi:PhzF family phenazine biosynthesis protein [Rhodopirellula sp. P2]|uniref:PhzF family phenazine biosynthesis protein n=1 Tax=Rhodopirellula sp. P2 TaxID=2127060 RepID=UPI002368F190|nr:PhzF family phenazine biosynthesis protein [Rhodopirellula sp. P2]WDQ17265.1 PhzF family phenazine biosynthesis protein [Rhodopirellula sp. P2]